MSDMKNLGVNMKFSKKILSFVLAALILFGSVGIGGEGFDIFSVKASAGEILVWPTQGYTELSQGLHNNGCAIDIKAPSGAEIISAIAGTVYRKYTCTGNGCTVDSTCCYGNGTGLIILGFDGRYYHYSHMIAGSIPSNINVGSSVSQAQKIGLVGSTGNATGPHLHFGISSKSNYSYGGWDPRNETYGFATKPTSLKLSLNTTNLKTGDTVKITASANDATYITYGIDWYNSSTNTWSRIETKTFNSASVSATYKVSKSGKYTIYFTAGNNIGYVDSNKISFTVTDPTYSISYNANGGSGAPSKQTKTYGKNLTLSSTNPTRTGYTFKNWNTKSDGSGTSYAAGAAYSANSSVTLYAQWVENYVRVMYYSNYADVSSSSVDNPVNASKNVVVRDVKYYYSYTENNGLYNYSYSGATTYLGKEGYKGTGYWNTKPDGTGVRIHEDLGFTGKKLAEMLGVNIDKSSVTVNLYPEWVSDHNHTYVTSTVAPTCSEKGYTLYTCSCGYSYKDNYIDALGHNYKYVYNNDATESRDGTETQICTRCGAKGTTRTKSGTKSGVAKIAIDGYIESVTLSYKSTLKLHSIADNMPDGAEICWVYTDKNGEPQYYFGESLTLSKMRKSTAVVACVALRDEDDAENSVVIATSEVINVQVKTGFFSKLIAFFRMLFGSLPEIELKSQYATVTTARIKEETTTQVIVSDPNLGTTSA